MNYGSYSITIAIKRRKQAKNAPKTMRAEMYVQSSKRLNGASERATVANGETRQWGERGLQWLLTRRGNGEQEGYSDFWRDEAMGSKRATVATGETRQWGAREIQWLPARWGNGDQERATVTFGETRHL